MYLRQELFFAAVLIVFAVSTQSASVSILINVNSISNNSNPLSTNHPQATDVEVLLVTEDKKLPLIKAGNKLPVIKAGNKSYYLGVTSELTWINAQRVCRSHGMDLVSISSEQENDQLINLIMDAGFGGKRFWTSGVDLLNEGEFVWMGNGRSQTFENWDENQPSHTYDGSEEHCLEIKGDRGFKWNDSSCLNTYHFICEVMA